MLRVLVVLVAGCSAPAKAPASSSPHEHHVDSPPPVEHRFQNAARWAKIFDDPSRDEWQQPDKVIAAIGITSEMTVADVGAGTGYFSVRFAKVALRVIATDVEPDMIRYIDERAAHDKLTNITAKVTPKDDPQLGTATVDRIVIVDTWHHIADRGTYAKKLAVALKPGGAVAIVDFKLDAPKGPPRAHRIAPEVVIAELAAGGIDGKVVLDLRDQFVVLGVRK